MFAPDELDIRSRLVPQNAYDLIVLRFAVWKLAPAEIPSPLGAAKLLSLGYALSGHFEAAYRLANSVFWCDFYAVSDQIKLELGWQSSAQLFEAFYVPEQSGRMPEIPKIVSISCRTTENQCNFTS